MDLFRAGMDTIDIAKRFGTREALICDALSKMKTNQHAQRRSRSRYFGSVNFKPRAFRLFAARMEGRKMKIGDDFETYLRFIEGRKGYFSCFPGTIEADNAMGFITVSACHGEKSFTWHESEAGTFVLAHIDDSLSLADEIDEALSEIEAPKPS